MATAAIEAESAMPREGLLAANLEALDVRGADIAACLASSAQLDDSGRWDFGDGRVLALHSRLRPIEDAERALSGIVVNGYPTHLVVIGLGLGYVLDAIERWPVATRVLAIETEPAILGAMLRRRDWRTWLESGRLQIVAAPDYAGSADAWLAFGATDLPPVVVHPVLAREKSAEILKARLHFERMRFRTPLDPRVPTNSQSMLHHTVLTMYEHFAATAIGGILEIGAYVGGGTMAICRGIRQTGRVIPFWSIEMGGDYSTHPHLPSADIFGDLQRNLRRHNLEHLVTLVEAPADDAAVVARLQGAIAPLGLSIFNIDADGNVQRDFDNFLHLCRPGCAVVVDDYSSPHAAEKVGTTVAAVDRMVSAGVLRSDGVHGWGTWIGRVVRPPQR
jgi:predicted O-methyltransferase YrrM